MSPEVDLRKKVLIVDDEEEILTYFAECIRDVLGEDQIQVDTCNSGQDALELVFTVKYDLILSDIKMPKMSGFDLIKQAFREELNRETPVVFISGYLEKFDAELSSQEFENIQYLDKPVDEETITQLVGVILNISPKKVA